MIPIKYDFKSCYDVYNFSQFDCDEVDSEDEQDDSDSLLKLIQCNDYNYDYDELDTFAKTVEDIINVLLIQYGIEPPQPKFVRFPDPVKLLTTCKRKVRKTLPITPEFINFNKTKMAKHPNTELDTAQIFTSNIDMLMKLNSEKACRKHLEKLRWNGEPICPHCGSQREDHYRILTRGEDKGRYKCKDCRLPFSVTIGTIFEKSTIPLQKWFMAVFLFVTNKKGISSRQLQSTIGVSQKSAWFMLSRLRNAVHNRVEFEFDGITQVDETYVGGKNKNRGKEKKIENTQGRSLKTKTPVFGMLNNGLVYTQVVKNTKGKTLQAIIDSKVKKGSTIVSDGWRGYRGLENRYSHEVIKHNLGLFKKGSYHTNGIEGFWGLLKRGIVGMYHYTSDKHLHRYCDEFAYRYNIRTMSPGERFNLTLINSDERLSYKELTA
ncbi:IS1595 family transposase [Flavobacterium denitrificans]|uniref:IS1595 family transposase n=1 Tax=Flavobacterium denitrificans TaxID=281361 RepID=UPI00040A77DA|nr:IS1595 family transposase [Flavobacterium denitrificans]